MNKVASKIIEKRLTMGGGPRPLPTNELMGRKTSGQEDIVDQILTDHVPLKNLIASLKDKDLGRSQKQDALEEFVPLLLSHAKAEQQSLYFALKARSNFRTDGFEGETEHVIAEELSHKINATPDDDDWNAKVKVLAEMVEHHIKEEEDDILKRVKNEIDEESRNIIGAEYSFLKSDYDLLRMSPKRETLGTSKNTLN